MLNSSVNLAWVLSRVWFFAAPWTVALQDPLSKGFSRQEYWSAIFSSRGSSWPRDQTHISCTAGRFFTTEPSGKTSVNLELYQKKKKNLWIYLSIKVSITDWAIVWPEHNWSLKGQLRFLYCTVYDGWNTGKEKNHGEIVSSLGEGFGGDLFITLLFITLLFMFPMLVEGYWEKPLEEVGWRKLGLGLLWAWLFQFCSPLKPIKVCWFWPQTQTPTL